MHRALRCTHGHAHGSHRPLRPLRAPCSPASSTALSWPARTTALPTVGTRMSIATSRGPRGLLKIAAWDLRSKIYCFTTPFRRISGRPGKFAGEVGLLLCAGSKKSEVEKRRTARRKKRRWSPSRCFTGAPKQRCYVASLSRSDQFGLRLSTAALPGGGGGANSAQPAVS